MPGANKGICMPPNNWAAKEAIARVPLEPQAYAPRPPSAAFFWRQEWRNSFPLFIADLVPMEHRQHRSNLGAPVNLVA
jgi:hypothetical protein